MTHERIVFFEEIGRDKKEWNCYPCNLNGVSRPADVALLSHRGVRITALCAHHAECWSGDTSKINEKQAVSHV